MDARRLGRWVAVQARGPGAVRSAWRRRRADAAVFRRRPLERARTPGLLLGADPEPGGGRLRFARSVLRLRVSAGGALFVGWDGCGPLPSYALVDGGPAVDGRAVLEPDTGGGWRLVSERVLVTVSRHGAVEVRTPGGVLLRRDLPPRWWEPAGASGAGEVGEAHWEQRAEVPAEARFFGPGATALGTGPPCLTVPVQWVVADAGAHLVFHDNTSEGRVVVRQGREGAGSGHDRPGRSRVRMSGGPLRYWVLPGPPARALREWAALTGAPAVPQGWAPGFRHAR